MAAIQKDIFALQWASKELQEEFKKFSKLSKEEQSVLIQKNKGLSCLVEEFNVAIEENKKLKQGKLSLESIQKFMANSEIINDYHSNILSALSELESLQLEGLIYNSPKNKII